MINVMFLHLKVRIVLVLLISKISNYFELSRLVLIVLKSKELTLNFGKCWYILVINSRHIAAAYYVLIDFLNRRKTRIALALH